MPNRLVLGINVNRCFFQKRAFEIARRATPIVVGVVTASLNLMQAIGDEPKFEVASIKPSPPDARMIIGPELRHGRLTASTVTLWKMLATAYGLTSARIIGPQWMDKEHFDVVAKAPDGIPDTEIKIAAPVTSQRAL